MRPRYALAPVLILVTACAAPDAPAPITLPAAPAAEIIPTGEQERLRDVARALAMGLRDAAARVQVRNAMRRSPMTEHKLVLQEFVVTPEGKALLRSAAEASGTTPSSLLARISALPPMDFYAPFRDHRLTWRAGGDVGVAYTTDPRASMIEGFGTDGGALGVDIRGAAPARALLLLHPAERKSERIDPQPDRTGDVIQDEDDGELSGTLEWTDGRGRVHRMAFGGRRRAGAESTDSYALASACDPTALDGCDPSEETGGPGAITADTTFLDTLWVSYGDGFGTTTEVELQADFYSGGVLVERSTARFEGVDLDRWYSPHKPLIFRRMRQGSSDYIRIHVVEKDPFDDDDKGSRNFYTSDNGQVRSIIDEGAFFEGQSVTNVLLRWVPKQ